MLTFQQGKEVMNQHQWVPVTSCTNPLCPGLLRSHEQRPGNYLQEMLWCSHSEMKWRHHISTQGRTSFSTPTDYEKRAFGLSGLLGRNLNGSLQIYSPWWPSMKQIGMMDPHVNIGTRDFFPMFSFSQSPCAGI